MQGNANSTGPLKTVQAWYKRNMEIHGWALLALAGFVYFGQGGRGGLSQSLGQLGFYEFEMESADITDAGATGTLPWNFKFLFGLISDNIPLFGYNVKPYMFGACILGFVSIAMMSFTFLTPTFSAFTIAYTMMQFYGAIVDCLSDALIVKSGKDDEVDSSSGLQSISWFSLGVGGGLFALLFGYMGSDDNAKGGVSVSGVRHYNLIQLVFPVVLFFLLFFVKEKKTTFKPSPKELMKQLVRLFVALFSPPFLVIRVLLWITLANISVLSGSGSPMTPFVQETLGISLQTLSYLDAASYGFLAIGVVTYYKFFRHTKFRWIFGVSQVVTAVLLLADAILLLRLNIKFGIPDVPFLFTTTAFNEVVNRLNAMPFLVMAAQLCPDNMEATFFAALMSVSNTGSTLSQYLSAEILRRCKVDVKDLVTLPERQLQVVFIRSALVMIVCFALPLLPNTSSLSSTNVESLRPTNPTIIKILKWADMYHEDAELEAGKQDKK